MIAFTIITDTPARLRTQLIARGILLNQPGIVPAREGFEYVELDWPVPGFRAFSIKLVRAAKDDEIAGEKQDDRLQWQRTKFGKWITANGVADTVVIPAVTDDEGKVLKPERRFRARRVGTNFWLIREDDAAQFHAWL